VRAHQAAGKHQPSDDCADCDDWKTEGPHWLKANPNLGVSLSWQYLREQVAKAIDAVEAQHRAPAEFLPVDAAGDGLDPTEAWARCKGAASSASLAGRECFSASTWPTRSTSRRSSPCSRASSRSRLSPSTSGRTTGDAANAAADERTITCAYDVLSFFWMPKRHARARAQGRQDPVSGVGEDGHVFTTPGKLIDHDAIVDYIIGTLAAKFASAASASTRAGAAGVVSKLQRHFGDELVEEIPQGFRPLSEPSKTLEALIGGHIGFARQQPRCQAWCVGNMAIEENKWREIRPVKISQRKRIDGGVALIDAIRVSTLVPGPKRSVYATRGAIVMKREGDVQSGA
jgi:hypothetical protein